MAEKLKWKVLRRHEGDRVYEEGDTRIGTRAELAHLEGKVLEHVGSADEPAAEPASAAPAAKAETAPLNKAESAAPANKAASSRKSKDK